MLPSRQIKARGRLSFQYYWLFDCCNCSKSFSGQVPPKVLMYSKQSVSPRAFDVLYHLKRSLYRPNPIYFAKIFERGLDLTAV